MQRFLREKLLSLSEQIAKFNLVENMLSLNTRRYLMINFWSGVSRGMGITLGATIFGALIIFFMQRLVVLNLPVVGDFIANLVRIILAHL
ncbi:MAG: DUF5665 domain-containing protein [Bacillota bacterium]|nr:DUF5665 domain-containing protein [Bacillota bacterium]